MPTVKELREKRAELVPRLHELRDAAQGRDFTAEEKANWEGINTDYDSLTRDIERQERVATVTSEQEARTDDRIERKQPGEPTDSGKLSDEETRTVALQAWCRSQAGLDLTEDQMEACRQVRLNPNRRTLDIPLADSRGIGAMADAFRSRHPSIARRTAQSAVIGSTGGYLVPEGFVRQLEVALLAFGGVLQVADIIRTDEGNDLPMPTSDDTSNTGELIGESEAVSEQHVTVGQMVLKASKYSSKLIKVPAELLEDSAFDLASFIAERLGERLGRIMNTYLTTGTGAGMQPKGIVTAATLGVTAASATAIAADEIMDLIHSVDPAYRPGSRFMFHDAVLLYLRQLKDGEGRYLWQNGMGSGAPDTLYSYPLTINQDMQGSVASATKTIIFGQLSKYKVRQVRGVRMRRLVERYADYDQEGFMAFMRMDGNLLDAGTHPVKYLLQA